MIFKYIKRPKARELFETKVVWDGAYEIYNIGASECECCGHVERARKGRRPKSPGDWVCQYCGGDMQMKYIATGHDHTDYSYHVCGCDGARRHGKPYSQLN